MLRYGLIQALRAIAANMVVASHIIGLHERFYPQFGKWHDLSLNLAIWGVGCFFAISGFVLTRAAMREDWLQFLMRRLLRIYPIYWIYLLITAAFIVLWQGEHIDFSRFVASTLLIPGAPQIVSVAWSLVFEVYFYGVIVVFLFLGANLRYAYGLWALAVVGLSLVAPSSFLGHLIALKFMAGAVGALFLRTLVDRAISAVWTPRWLQQIGDASYSIYLGHFLVVAALSRVLFAVMPGQAVLSCTTCLLAANVAGLASYRWVERPILNLLKNFQWARSATSASAHSQPAIVGNVRSPRWFKDL
jgi:exopolysaccharide production protein ExoZ